MYHGTYGDFVAKTETLEVATPGELFDEAEKSIWQKKKYWRQKIDCQTCGKSIYKIRRKEHLDECLSSERRFQCTEEGCVKKFNTRKDMEKHQKAVHTPPLLCPYEGCGKLVKKRNFKSHVDSVHKKVKANCKFCNEEVIKNYMSFHWESCVVKQLVDPKPEKSKKKSSSSKKSSLSTKMRTCPICSKEVKYSSFAAHHDRCKSDGSRIHPCTFEGCTKSFVTKWTRNVHIRDMHRRYLRVRCSFDGCTYECKTNRLKIHMLSVHRNGTCPNCDMEMQMGELHKHRISCGGEPSGKLVKCPIEECSKVMYCSALKNHVREVHNRPMNKCEKCGSLILVEQLTKHFEQCSGTKQYIEKGTCYHCKKFLTKTSLTKHFKVCPGTKGDLKIEMAQCDYCKREVRKTGLVRHFSKCSKAVDWLKAFTNFEHKSKRVRCEHCKQLISRENLMRHFETCEQEEDLSKKIKMFPDLSDKVRCDHCQTEVLKRNLARHFRSCDAAISDLSGKSGPILATCDHCQMKMWKSSITRHFETCPGITVNRDLPRPSNNVQCDYCKAEMLKSSLIRHFRVCNRVNSKIMPDKLSERVMVWCAHCKSEMFKEDLITHFQTCENHPISCERCLTLVSKSNLPEHLKSCTAGRRRFQKSTCPQCQEIMPNWMFYLHFKSCQTKGKENEENCLIAPQKNETLMNQENLTDLTNLSRSRIRSNYLESIENSIGSLDPEIDEEVNLFISEIQKEALPWDMILETLALFDEM